MKKPEKKKTKKERKAEELEKFRRREGFLPYYSDTFFDEIKATAPTVCGWTIFAIFILELLLASDWKIILIYAVTAALCFLAYGIWRSVENRMKHFGYQIEDDALIRSAWGGRKVIPYEEIRSVMMTTPVKMTVRAIMIPSPHGYIRFPYEVGNAKQQKHIMECYDKVKEKAPYEMPPMVVKTVSHFDRMYAYNRTFRNSFVWFFFSELLLCGCNLMQGSASFDFIGYLLPVVMQCGVLDKMARCVRLGTRNAAELQLSLKKYPAVTYKIKYRKNWQFLLAAGVVIVMNALNVWCCWKFNW